MTKYNTFSDIENKLLRIWNRTAMYFNIYQDRGKEAAVAYMKDNFNEEEINEVFSMLKEVENNGYTSTRTYVNRVVQNETVQ